MYVSNTLVCMSLFSLYELESLAVLVGLDVGYLAIIGIHKTDRHSDIHFSFTPQLDNRQLRYWNITFYRMLQRRNCIGHCVT